MLNYDTIKELNLNHLSLANKIRAKNNIPQTSSSPDAYSFIITVLKLVYFGKITKEQLEESITDGRGDGGFDADFLLRHSFQREIYAVPLARNFREFLKGDHCRLRYYDNPLNDLVAYWKERWFSNRKRNIEIKKSVYSFRAENFSIS